MRGGVMNDHYPYAVFTLSPGDCTNDRWDTAVWWGEANGHDDAIEQANLTPPDIGFAPMRVLTVCLFGDGHTPCMREHKLSRTVETVA